jgi:hypothetical protein
MKSASSGWLCKKGDGSGRTINTVMDDIWIALRQVVQAEKIDK